MSVQGEGRPPNIVMILCDQLRADALGCFGNRIVQTPHIGRLARRGTLFSDCMITQPTCTPSRASILSGCYPSALRTRMVGCQTPDDPRLLPRVLGRSGYRTASIGKLHLAPQAQEPALIRATGQGDGRFDYYGFQEIDLVNGHGDRCFGHQFTAERDRLVPDAAERVAERQAYARGTDDTYHFTLPATIHSSNYIGEKTVNFLRTAGERPFFLHVSFPDPHQPFTVPPPYDSLYQAAAMPAPIPPLAEHHNMPPWYWQAHTGQGSPNVEAPAEAHVDRVTGTKPIDYRGYAAADYQQTKAIYYGMITLLDQNVGRILDALDDTGLADNTIIVFLSDHGEYLGDYGLVGKGLHFDCVLRTPLIFAGPGIRQAAQQNGIASTLDIAPTLLALAGLNEPEAMQGHSMQSLLSGAEDTQRQTALTENDDDFVPMKARTLTTERWKLTRYAGQAFGELYDRENDPLEMHNLWNDPGYATIQTGMTEMLLEEVLCSMDVSNRRRQRPQPRPFKWLPRHHALEKLPR